jgi:hypothetical protein
VPARVRREILADEHDNFYKTSNWISPIGSTNPVLEHGSRRRVSTSSRPWFSAAKPDVVLRSVQFHPNPTICGQFVAGTGFSRQNVFLLLLSVQENDTENV